MATIFEQVFKQYADWLRTQPSFNPLTFALHSDLSLDSGQLQFANAGFLYDPRPSFEGATPSMFFQDCFTSFATLERNVVDSFVDDVIQNGWEYAPISTKAFCYGHHLRPSKIDCDSPSFLWIDSPICYAYEDEKTLLEQARTSKHRNKLKHALSSGNHATLVGRGSMLCADGFHSAVLGTLRKLRPGVAGFYALHQLMFGYFAAITGNGELVAIHDANENILGYVLFVLSEDEAGNKILVHQGFHDPFRIKDFGKFAVALSLFELHKKYGDIPVDMTVNLRPNQGSFAEYKRLFAHVSNYRPLLSVGRPGVTPNLYKGVVCNETHVVEYS